MIINPHSLVGAMMRLLLGKVARGKTGISKFPEK